MKPIRVRFKQLPEAPNVLLYQCLQTPDELRGKADVISSGVWSIRSDTGPAISPGGGTLWIGGRGVKEDDRIYAANYPDSATTLTGKETFSALIRKWNAENADRPTPTAGGIPWVSVDERLPKEAALYLVLPHNGPPIVVMFTPDGRWEHLSIMRGVPCTLTHWAPINPPIPTDPATNDGWEVVE